MVYKIWEWYAPAYSTTSFSIALLHHCFPQPQVILGGPWTHQALSLCTAIERALHTAWTALLLPFTQVSAPHRSLSLENFPDSSTWTSDTLCSSRVFYFLNCPITIENYCIFKYIFHAFLVYIPFSRSPWTGYLLKGKDYVLFITVYLIPITEWVINHN